jgi:energy-converting hydrogenase Eha subunit C
MDFNFARLDLFITGSADAPPAKPATPTDQALAHVSHMLHRALLNSPEQLRCEIRVQGAAPLKLMWVGAGQTAGVAHWIRDRRVEAISLLLSGIDPVEDLAAIQLVMSALACLYSATEYLRDVAISTAAESLAIAFFGMLGVTNESESRSC